MGSAVIFELHRALDISFLLLKSKMLEVKEQRSLHMGIREFVTAWREIVIGWVKASDWVNWHPDMRKGGGKLYRGGGLSSESLTNIEVVLGLPAVLQVVDERMADLTLQSNS